MSAPKPVRRALRAALRVLRQPRWGAANLREAMPAIAGPIQRRPEGDRVRAQVTYGRGMRIAWVETLKRKPLSAEGLLVDFDSSPSPLDPEVTEVVFDFDGGVRSVAVMIHGQPRREL